MALKAQKNTIKTNAELVAEAVAAGVIARPVETDRDAAFYFEEASNLAEKLGFDAKDPEATINRVRGADARNKLCAALFGLHLAVRFPHIETPTAEALARDLMLFSEVTDEQFKASDFEACEFDADSIGILIAHLSAAEARERKQLEIESA